MKQLLRYCALTCCALITASTSGFTQAQFTISGTVSDSTNGEVLIGAAVWIEGTQNGTIVGLDGTFELKINKIKIDTLVVAFQFVGYQKKVMRNIGWNGDVLTVNIQLTPIPMRDIYPFRPARQVDYNPMSGRTDLTEF